MPLHTRRDVLSGSAATLAAAALASPAQAATPLRLRLLETSDLHMFVLDWDYYHRKSDATVGLDRVASLIEAARRAQKNSLLFDNGDLIQGNPLGDFLASEAWTPAQGVIHPAPRALHALGYDAAALGNHEFNFGLDFLARAYAGAAFPVLCANVLCLSAWGPDADRRGKSLIFLARQGAIRGADRQAKGRAQAG